MCPIKQTGLRTTLTHSTDSSSILSYNSYMKERFETTLKAVAKEELTENDTDAIEMIERFVDAETMNQIRQLQLGKLDLVNQLKEWRKKFWNEEADESKLEDRPGAKTLYIKDGEYKCSRAVARRLPSARAKS